MADSDILNGAIQAAAGQTLGLTQDQVLDLKRQQLREKQRKNRSGRAEREGNRQRAEGFLRDDDRSFESIGSFQEQERYPDPFGVPRSAADPDEFSYEDQRAITEAANERERGNYVTVDRGRGKERLWRERGQYSAEPKYAKNKRPDMADPFYNPQLAPQGAGMGGSTGLATQLADMLARGEVDPSAIVPGTAPRSDIETRRLSGKARAQTIAELVESLGVQADPEQVRNADRAQAARARAGLTGSEIQERSALAARLAASPQGENIRGLTSSLTGTTGANLSGEEIKAIRQEAILKSITGDVTPGGPSVSFNADVELAINAAVQDRLTTGQANAVDPIRRAAIERRNAQEAVNSIVSGGASLADIENIQTLGLASKKFNRGADMSEFNVVQGVDPTTFGDVYQVESWPEGIPLGFRDANTDQWVADVNAPGADNISNAPMSRTATWMEGNLPGYGREGGTSFGQRSVNPGDELGMLNSRLGQFGSPTGIRGIQDLENAVRGVTVDAAFRGATMYNYSPEAGKAVGVTNPGLDEVLYGLGYTADEKTRLALALQTVEAAQSSPVNSGAKEMYAAGVTPSGYERVVPGFETNVQLGRITNERVGNGKNRKGIRGQLAALTASPEEVFKGRDPSTIYAITPDGQSVLLPDAQQDLVDARIALDDARRPFQAVPAGKDPEPARFLSAKGAKMTSAERVAEYGEEMGGIGNEVERRKNEYDERRASEKVSPDATSKVMRERDARFEAEGSARRSQDSYDEKIRLRGNHPLGHGIPHTVLQTASPQQATSAVTNAAPDPIPLAARGGWMGGPGTGRAASPWDRETRVASAAQKAAPRQQPLPGISYNETAPDPWTQPVGTGNGITQERERRMSSEMLNTLAELNSGPAQGPVPGSARKQFTDRGRNFGKSPKYERINKYGRRSAIAGGGVAALAGISGLINGERNKREEEQYQ